MKTYAIIRDFEEGFPPVILKSETYLKEDKKYLVLCQPEIEPNDGYNLVIQNEDTGDIMRAMSIDFDFETVDS